MLEYQVKCWDGMQWSTVTIKDKGNSSKVTIIEPGIVKTIDGKEYHNSQRIIAGNPDDVAAYHKERAQNS